MLLGVLRSFLVLILVSGWIRASFAQNLLPNPSFESKEKNCPPEGVYTSYQCVHAWQRIGNGTPDFHSEKVFAPKRQQQGYVAVEGDGFAGISMIGGIPELMYAPLSERLAAGETYTFEAFVRFAVDMTRYRQVELGVWLLTSERWFDGSKPHARIAMDSIRTEFYQRIRMSLVPKGTERILVFGPVEKELEELEGHPSSYLLVDEVAFTKNEMPPDDGKAVFKFHFDSGSDQLKDAQLDKMINNSQAHSIKLFNIVGYTDVVGSEDANLELSIRRCEAVKRAVLSSNLVDEGRIHIYPQGEAHALETEDEALKQRDRKVEVIIYFE